MSDSCKARKKLRKCIFTILFYGHKYVTSSQLCQRISKHMHASPPVVSVFLVRVQHLLQLHRDLSVSATQTVAGTPSPYLHQQPFSTFTECDSWHH